MSVWKSVYVRVTCVWLPRGKKKALEFLELNLQAAVSWREGSGN